MLFSFWKKKKYWFTYCIDNAGRKIIGPRFEATEKDAQRRVEHPDSSGRVFTLSEGFASPEAMSEEIRKVIKEREGGEEYGFNRTTNAR